MSLLVNTVRLLHEMSEFLNDSLYSIRTAGYVRKADAGVSHPDAEQYAATPYRVIRRLFRELPPEAVQGAFIDYGSGRGRVSIMAARHRFRHVIGIEISESLHRQAQENLRTARVRGTANVEFLRADAAEFVVPDDATVLYLYKPFGPMTTKQVLRRWCDSLHRNPREVWILSYNASLLIETARAELNAELVRRRTTVYPTIPWAVLRVAA